MKNYLSLKQKVIKSRYLVLTLLLLIVCVGMIPAQNSSPKYRILMDIAHKQRFDGLYMTSWQGVNDYQCSEFMNDVFKWLLN